MVGAKNSFGDIPNNTASSWWKDPSLRKNVIHCIGLCACPYYLGYDASLLTGLQAVPEWNAYFGSPKSTKLGLIVASLALPSVLSSYLSDAIAQRFGRKIDLWVAITFMIIGTFVNTFATSLGMFIGGRVIIGWGGGMTKVVAPTLLQEIAHPRLRPRIAAYYYCNYYVGSVLSAWLTFGTLYMKSNWSWRLPALFQVVGPFIVVALTWNIPESPRWLVKKGRREEALQALGKYHANGETMDPLVQYEFSEITATIELEEQQSRVSYRDFFRTKPNIHRLFLLVACSLGQNWIGNGPISYYLSPILKDVGITAAPQIAGINGGLQIWNLIAAYFGATFVERLGRRPLWFISTTGMFFSNAAIMGLSGGYASTKKKSLGTAVVPFLYIFYGFYDFGWTPLPYSYCTELLPYNMRTKGIAIFVSSQNIGQAFNQFVNPIALANIGYKYYGVYLVIQVAYLTAMYFYFPETRHRTIEEVSMILDERYGLVTQSEAKQLRANALRGDKPTEETIEGVEGDRKEA